MKSTFYKLFCVVIDKPLHPPCFKYFGAFIALYNEYVYKTALRQSPINKPYPRHNHPAHQFTSHDTDPPSTHPPTHSDPIRATQ